MSPVKIKRHKVTSRDTFSYDFKQRIMQKSDEKCCICGKKCYIGYGATIDHFIPIIRGGTNDEANLVQMCEECNKQKDDQIYSPSYVEKYLTKDAYDALWDYVYEYFNSYEYADSKNLMVFDKAAYTIALDYSGHKTRHKAPVFGIKYEIIKAREEDFEALSSFYAGYIKKHGYGISAEDACLDVRFFYNFYATYYVKKGGEITAMMVITAQKSNGALSQTTGEMEMALDTDKVLSFLVFSRYVNDASKYIVKDIIYQFNKEINYYHGIDYIPIKITTASDDVQILSVMHTGTYPSEISDFFSSTNIIFTPDKRIEEKNGNRENFWGKIKYNLKKMENYLKENGIWKNGKYLIDFAYETYSNPVLHAMDAANKEMMISLRNRKDNK